MYRLDFPSFKYHGLGEMEFVIKIWELICAKWGIILRAPFAFFGMAGLGFLAGWTLCGVWDGRSISITKDIADFQERRAAKAEAESSMLRTDKQLLMAEKEQLSKENAALKKTGAFVPEQFIFQNGGIASSGTDSSGKFNSMTFRFTFNISNGAPAQRVTLEISSSPGSAISEKAMYDEYQASMKYHPEKREYELECFPPKRDRADILLIVWPLETITFEGPNFEQSLTLRFHPNTNDWGLGWFDILKN